MKARLALLVAVAASFPCLSGTLLAQHQTDTLDNPVVEGVLPYRIDLREITLDPAPIPSIHSVAAAEWDGQWVFLGGRTNGLHGMTGMNAFDPTFENRDLWVVDPVGRRSWHKSLETSSASGLTMDQVDSLSAVNTEFYQDDDKWIIVGGYGFKRSVGDHQTYDTLSVIDLPGIVAWIKAPTGAEATLAKDHISQVRDRFFQVTGGGLVRIGEEYQLIFGQNYEGRYRPMFNGVYTQQVRRFTIDLSDGLSVPPDSKQATPPFEAYRRRDLNIATILLPSGVPGGVEEGAVALSGVFTPDNGVWTVPVVVEAMGQVSMADPNAPDTLKQGLQIYHCAKVGLYHRATEEMHLVLFGGITVLEFDALSGSWSSDPKAPFSNQCSAVVRKVDGTFKQYHLPTRFPRILADQKELRFGANAEFFLNPATPMLHPMVIDLAAIREPMVIGHVFGGLVADAGNAGNTGSSGRVFEVVLTPTDLAVSTKIARDRANVSLSWDAIPYASYVIEGSGDLKDWEVISEKLDADAEGIDWSETLNDSTQFYRVLGGILSHAPE